MRISDEHVQHYHDHGYAIVEKLFDPSASWRAPVLMWRRLSPAG